MRFVQKPLDCEVRTVHFQIAHWARVEMVCNLVERKLPLSPEHLDLPGEVVHGTENSPVLRAAHDSIGRVNVESGGEQTISAATNEAGTSGI